MARGLVSRAGAHLSVAMAVALAATAAGAGEPGAAGNDRQDDPRAVPVNGLKVVFRRTESVAGGRRRSGWQLCMRNVSSGPLLLPGKFRPVFNVFARDAHGRTHFIGTWDKPSTVQNYGGLPLGVTVLPAGKTLNIRPSIYHWDRLPGSGYYDVWFEYRAAPTGAGPGVWLWSGTVVSNPLRVYRKFKNKPDVGPQPGDEEPAKPKTDPKPAVKPAPPAPAAPEPKRPAPEPKGPEPEPNRPKPGPAEDPEDDF